MLSWDEAWNLCALRYLAGGGDLFTFQFWRHPPIYMIFGFLLSPLKPGFEYRMEFLSLLLSTLALIALIKLISHVYGKHIALFTAIAYILLPGPLFFDTWVKRDPVVTLFGLLSVLAFFKRKNLQAGIFLGFALLGKETAMFYCAALFMMMVCQCHVRRFLKRFLVIFGPAFLIAGWWYVLVDRGSAGYFDFYSGHSSEAQDFGGPWWYYLEKLYLDLGLPGIILTVIGSLALLTSGSTLRKTGCDTNKLFFSRPRYFPFFLLLPTYLLLFLSSGKPFWITISLQPALALLTGIGLAFLWKLPKFFPSGNRKKITRETGLLGSAVVLAIILSIPLFGFNYKEYYKKYSPHYQSGIGISYEISEIVNKNVKDNEKILILPMLYRNGPTMPDPIFYWHLKVSPRILYNSNLKINYPELEGTVVKHKINWILMCPVDGSSQFDILKKLITEIYPTGYQFSQGVLLKVDPLWNK